MNRKSLISILVLFAIYFAAYIYVREINQEIWEKDGRTYIIFPENKFIYYLFRPVSILDERLTGVGSHIGKHK